ncbi:type IV secretion system protein VirB5 [Palleronia aestuarii]|uniref:Type IV secretion system protein VirB5 n=1 Tax=Palleronia aestuarii TaxID=568105 RepID=A0A2W7N299_9RHOB|nr:type IV secretion system protein [Palleronia aestuarii]PZX14180.1 type IV secretion system protein VirB5 [Palleronia aestuarii]
MIRRLRNAAALAAITAGALASAPAHAQGVPTFDAASVAQAIAQLEQMRQDYANQLQQLQSMTGDKAIAGILNSAPEIAARESAGSLSAIMSGGMTGAAIPGNASALTARMNELKTTFALPDLNGFLTSDTPQDRALATQAGAGLAAVATAEDTYARANTSMGRVNQLIGQIDGNADLKASVDYNTRMLGEIAVLLNESLRLQAAQANATGTDALLAAREQAASRTFMRVGDDG